MSVDVNINNRWFKVGEKPRPTPFEFHKSDGALDTQWNGWTIVAYYQNNALTEGNVPCANNGDGTGSITWPSDTSPSKFVEQGMMRIDLRATSGNLNETICRIRIPVRS